MKVRAALFVLVAIWFGTTSPPARASASASSLPPPPTSPPPAISPSPQPSDLAPAAVDRPISSLPARSNLPVPGTTGPFETTYTLLDDGCSYDLDTAPAIQWTDPEFGYTEPVAISFGDNDNLSGSDLRCPGKPARLVDMKSRVWYPGSNGKVAEGGPFPLVVILHGQQLWPLPGYEGYDYLGQLLASHGFVVASIDGRSLLDSTIKSRGEHIREHLRRFVRRNQAGSGSLFAGKLDLSHVTLIGHSRGGDAIVAAWEWQRVNPDPDYSLGALVAIAPVQFMGNSSSEPPITTHLRDIPYQIIHGSKDGDVSDFQGLRQYDRAAMPQLYGETPKSMVFIKDANHNYFNTVWEQYEGNDYCCGGVIASSSMRSLAMVYIHAFLEVYIHEDSSYLPWLQLPQLNPVQDTTVALDFQAPASQFIAIDHHEEEQPEDHDAFSNSVDEEITVTPESTQANYEEAWLAISSTTPLDSYPGETYGAHLLWATSSVYSSALPEGLTAGIDASTQQLSFRVGQVYRSSGSSNPRTLNQDLEVRLVDGSGSESGWVRVSQFSPIFPCWTTAEGGIKSVMGTVRLPLSAFADVDYSTLQRLDLRFEVSPTGELIFDDIRFSE